MHAKKRTPSSWRRKSDEEGDDDGIEAHVGDGAGDLFWTRKRVFLAVAMATVLMSGMTIVLDILRSCTKITEAFPENSDGLEEIV